MQNKLYRRPGSLLYWYSYTDGRGFPVEHCTGTANLTEAEGVAAQLGSTAPHPAHRAPDQAKDRSGDTVEEAIAQFVSYCHLDQMCIRDRPRRGSSLHTGSCWAQGMAGNEGRREPKRRDDRDRKRGGGVAMASGREDGRKDRTLSTRELTDITESLRWKADQDLDAAKRLKGAGGVVDERWEGLDLSLIHI